LRKLNTTHCYISGYGYTDNGNQTKIISKIINLKNDKSSKQVIQFERKDGTIRWVLKGILAFGIGKCGQRYFPSTQTKVEYYLDWIENQKNLMLALPNAKIWSWFERFS
jgi:secreted trypsin-like serine protease